MADERSILDTLPEAVVVVDERRRVVRRQRSCGDAARPRPGRRRQAARRGPRPARRRRRPLPRLASRPPTVGDRLAERVLRVGRRPTVPPGRHRRDAGSDGQLVLTARSAGRREQLDAVRGDVVATVSHEIRSPLTSVKGFTRTLLARWDRFSDEQKRAMLETIDADADRVTRLLKELLDVSRIDAGRVAAAPQPRRRPGARLRRGRQGPPPRRRRGTASSTSTRGRSCRRCSPTPTSSSRCWSTSSRTRSATPTAASRSASSLDDDDLHLVVADEGPGIPRGPAPARVPEVRPWPRRPAGRARASGSTSPGASSRPTAAGSGSTPTRRSGPASTWRCPSTRRLTPGPAPARRPPCGARLRCGAVDQRVIDPMPRRLQRDRPHRAPGRRHSRPPLTRADLDALDEVRVRFTGKRSPLVELQQGMRDLTPDERKERGQQLNAFRAAFSAAYDARRAELGRRRAARPARDRTPRPHPAAAAAAGRPAPPADPGRARDARRLRRHGLRGRRGSRGRVRRLQLRPAQHRARPPGPPGDGHHLRLPRGRRGPAHPHLAGPGAGR